MATRRDFAANETAPVAVRDVSSSDADGILILERLLKKSDSPAVPIEKQRSKIVIRESLNWKWLGKFQFRHKVIGITFVGIVALPAALHSMYMAFIAADQYQSSASFAVRSIEAASGSDILGMFTQASSGNTASDSYILMDYILSERMVEDVDRRFDLESIYQSQGLDYYYGIGSNLPIEHKLAFWRDVINVSFDHASGIMQVKVKAFDPKQAQAIAKFVVEKSDGLVNALSLTARNDVLSAAQDEVLASEARLSKARAALREYRDRSQEISPAEGAKLAVQIITGLEQQLTQLNADLAAAKSQMSDDTPRIRVMKTRIKSLEQQLEVERQRLGTGEQPFGVASGTSSGQDVAGRIAQFEELETEREFAERAYTGSLTALEKSRIEANNRQRYLALFIEPTLSQLAQFPSRALNSLLVFVGLLFAWGVGVMSYYNIRDRA